jgi:Protein of unknown function (DUF3800)
MTYSDYVVYVDESGDHNLESVNEEYPVFVLTFCVFRKEDYINSVSPSVQEFKFKHFGHDTIILHEHEIRKQKKPFVFLKSEQKREVFMNDLTQIIRDAPMTIISAVIRKHRLIERYPDPDNPYKTALLFCMERLTAFLTDKNQCCDGAKTHIVFECRGKKEDADLELAFRRIRDGANMRGPMPFLDIVFAKKAINSAGLQVADLTARPIGLNVLRPDQANRAYDDIQPKLRRSPQGEVVGWGLKVFP